MLTGLRKMMCRHAETTPADEHGYAICVACGAAIPVTLTSYLLDEAFKSVLRRRG